MNAKIHPSLFVSSIKNNINELCKLYSLDARDFVFLSVKAAIFNSYPTKDIVVVDDQGNVVFNARYNPIATGERNNSFMEVELINQLSKKVMVTYDTDFVFGELKSFFKRSSSVFFLSKSHENGISLMKAISELIRKEKHVNLEDACKIFGVDCIGNGSALNKSMSMFHLYNKIKPLINIAETWMAGFKDINIEYLNSLPHGTSLCYWESKDKSRQMLFTPSSVQGSERVAELTDELKLVLDKVGYADFFITKNKCYSDIKIETLSIQEIKYNQMIDRDEYNQSKKNKLSNPRPPQKNKLRLTLRLDVVDANRNRKPKLKDIELYRPFLKVGDILEIENFIYNENLNVRKINFIDSTGQSCGTLMNESDQWLRVFGLIHKGYSTRIHVVSTTKGVKVDVVFNK